MKLPNREPEFRGTGMIARAEIPSDKATTIDKAENGIPIADSPGIAQKRIELFEREKYESILKARFFHLKHFSFLKKPIFQIYLLNN